MLIEKGVITNQTDLTNHPFEMILLNKNHLDQIKELQSTVIEGLKDKTLCVYLTDEELVEILETSGLAVGVLVAEKLVAFFSVLYPGAREDNLGLDIGLSKGQLMKVAHMESAFIHPDFRGNHLEERMINHLLASAKHDIEWRYLLATVSPYNYPSVKAALGANTVIVDLKFKYNNYWRYIFFQDNQNLISVDDSDTVPVLNTDLDKQLELLKQGYLGLKVAKSEEGFYIHYGKKR
ncbi:MAG: hypothetical protein FH758_12410 [Firmicutes bacterium]|nr:hypothetical protein [Bacillota bacterium]